MDPVSALGFAASIVQFITFTFDLLHSTHKIHSSISGTSEHCQNLENVSTRFLEFSTQLKDSKSVGTRSHNAQDESKHASSLKEIAQACARDCERLLEIVEKLRTRTGPERKWWQSFTKAILEVWTSKDVERLKSRLDEHRTSMILKLCAISEYV